MNFPQFRTLSLALPEVVEAPHFEKVSFRVKNKIFATYDIAKNQATLKLTLLDQSLLHDISLSHIYPVPNKWGNAGWTIIHLPELPTDLIIDCLKYAYSTVAPDHLSLAVSNTLMPNRDYIVQHDVKINASISTVWRLLTHYRFIKEWDELPDSVDHNKSMNEGDVLIWDLPNGQSSQIEVKKLVKEEMICQKLYVSSWPLARPFYNINYVYSIMAHGKDTALKIEIGDFGVLPNGQDYYNNSIIYAQNMSDKIQKLVALNTKELSI